MARPTKAKRITRSRAGVTGIGGIFFKCRDPQRLGAWYAHYLGVPIASWGGWEFRWREARAPAKTGATLWTPFARTTKYFAPSRKDFMFNLRVADLDATVAALRRRGVKVDGVTEQSEFGRFGWCMDPEGHRVELWQPPAAKAKRRPKSKRRTQPKASATKRKKATKRPRSRPPTR